MAGDRALKMLANHLQRIAILMPEDRLEKTRKLEIWIEHDHSDINVEPGPYHPDIEMKAGLYDKVLLYTGQKARAYAAANHMEYFAEGTKAHFYRQPQQVVLSTTVGQNSTTTYPRSSNSVRKPIRLNLLRQSPTASRTCRPLVGVEQ